MVLPPKADASFPSWRGPAAKEMRRLLLEGTYDVFGVDYEQSLFFLSTKDIANAGARKWVEEKQEIKHKKNKGFSSAHFPRAGVRDSFPQLDELKRKNRDCS